MPGLGVIILAAGASTRMKRPKQLLRWGDDSMLRVSCKTALQSCCGPVVVVLGCNAEACQQEIGDLPVATVVNPHWQSGMGSSVSTGVAELERTAPDIEGSLILLVDQPTVTVDLLHSLVAAWNPPQYTIAATLYQGTGGVPAVFDRSLFPDLKCLDPERGARPLINRHKAQTVLVDPGNILMDIDTEEAYSHALARSSDA